MAYIYKIKNNINGKIYIGKTLYSIEKRWGEHCRASRKDCCENRPLYSAMRKYGTDSFSIEEIEQCDDAMVSDREEFWIEFYGSFKNGYNATVGGDGKPYIDYDVVIETYHQIKNQKRVADMLGINSSTVRKILKLRNVDSLSSLEVNQIQKGYIVNMFSVYGEYIRTFPSAREAAKFILNGTDKDAKYGAISHITDVCKGKRKTAYGYRWKFASS